MPETQRRPEFVVVVDTKHEGKTVKIESVKDLEAFLYKFSNTELAQCFWDSLQFTYRSGVKSGVKKAGLPVAV